MVNTQVSTLVKQFRDSPDWCGAHRNLVGLIIMSALPHRNAVATSNRCGP